MHPLTRTVICSALQRARGALDAAAEKLEDLARVVSFAGGRLQFQVRPDDIFVVTYPRSGTTLMQLLLHLLTSDSSIEDFDHISEVAPWFERSLAVGALHARDLEALPSPRVFKSHLAYGWVPRGARCIYVVRDGRDVAVSYYHFYCSHLRYRGSFDEFLERFLRGDVQYGSWFKHVAAWEAHRDDPGVLLLRFEDLVAALPSCVDEIVCFCQIEVSPARVAEAVALCRFDRMKQHEGKFDFTTEKLLQQGYRPRAFLRQGKPGEGRLAMTSAQQAAFEREAHRDRRFVELEVDLPRFLR